jgi:pyruvate,water dikinase
VIWPVDNPPSTRYEIYTRGNVGEVFPDVVAPLSWTLFGIPGAEPGFRDAFVRFGVFDHDEFVDDNLEVVGVFGGYCYLNVSIYRIIGVRTPGLTPELVDYTLFGDSVQPPPYRPQPTDESPRHTARVEQSMAWLFTAADLPELTDDQRRVEALRASRPDIAAMSDEALVARAREFTAPFRELFSRHIYTSLCSTVALGTVSFVCAAALGDPTLAMALVAGLGDVDSAAPSFAMWELGRLAASVPAVAAGFDRGVDGLLDRLRARPEADAFLAGFSRFVAHYGSRGPNEWESRSPTWETRPEMALAAIDRMRVAPEQAAPELHRATLAAERKARAAEVLDKLADMPETRDQMAAALNASRLFLAGRERTKTTIIKLTHEIRVMLMELGRRMTEAGIFEKRENIGMLRDDELDDFLADPKAWRDTVLERERLFEKLQSLEPPFIVDGEVPAIETWPAKATAPAHVAAGTTLQGIPGCPGAATGRARVVLDAADPRGLEPGDVLVAPITDPSWTPLFVPAGAVVVNVGAQLSHAVIVSRELGIPCVVSVREATRRIPDGAHVRVDGTAGTVTVL